MIAKAGTDMQATCMFTLCNHIMMTIVSVHM